MEDLIIKISKSRDKEFEISIKTGINDDDDDFQELETARHNGTLEGAITKATKLAQKCAKKKTWEVDPDGY